MNNFTERKPFVSYLSKNEIRFAEQFASKHDLELITPRELKDFRNTQASHMGISQKPCIARFGNKELKTFCHRLHGL